MNIVWYIIILIILIKYLYSYFVWGGGDPVSDVIWEYFIPCIMHRFWVYQDFAQRTWTCVKSMLKTTCARSNFLFHPLSFLSRGYKEEACHHLKLLSRGSRLWDRFTNFIDERRDEQKANRQWMIRSPLRLRKYLQPWRSFSPQHMITPFRDIQMLYDSEQQLALSRSKETFTPKTSYQK